MLCAGGVALVMAVLLPSVPAQASRYGFTEGQTASINVARIKSALQLTAEQEPYWPAVDAALRDVARRQQTSNEQSGIVRRISSKVVSVVLDSVAIQRLVTAAGPLIARLDSQQMMAAQNLAHEMGLGPVVAALR